MQDKQAKQREYQQRYYESHRDQWNEYQKQKARERASELKEYRQLKNELMHLGSIIEVITLLVRCNLLDKKFLGYVHKFEEGKTVSN